jgi:hypothetical protein
MAPPNNGGSSKVFGQAMKKSSSKRSGNGGGGGSNYQRQFGGKGDKNNQGKKNTDTVNRSANDDDSTDNKAAELAQWRRIKQAKGEALDKAFGTERFAPSNHQTSTIIMNEKTTEKEPMKSRRGWLYNILPTTVCIFF